MELQDKTYNSALLIILLSIKQTCCVMRVSEISYYHVVYKQGNKQLYKQQTQFNLDPNRKDLTLFFLITYQAMILSAYTYLR